MISQPGSPPPPSWRAGLGLLHRESVYTAKLARRGIRLTEGRDISLLRGLRVGEVMDTEPATIPAGMPFSELVPRLLAGTRTELLVVDPKNRLLGTVSRQVVIDAYNRRVFYHDLTGGFGSLVEAVRSQRSIDVLAGITLTEIEVPHGLVGHTLSELDLRRRFGVEVVLIHSPTDDGTGLEGRPGKLPTPPVRIEAGDRLLVMGAPDAIQRLQDGLVDLQD